VGCLELLRQHQDLLVKGLLLQLETVLLDLRLPVPFLVEPVALVSKPLGELLLRFLLPLCEAFVDLSNALVVLGFLIGEDPLALVNLALHLFQALVLKL
jgi:hypothetical protein